MQINRRFYSAFCLLLIFHQKQHEIRLYLFKPRVSLLCIVSMNTLIELDSTITGDKIPPFYPFFFSATSHCCCSQQSAADDIFRDITDIFICHQTRSFTHLKGRLLTHSCVSYQYKDGVLFPVLIHQAYFRIGLDLDLS